MPLPLSRRRTKGLAFTCNACGARSVRRINPHAFTSGTVFVQCGNEACLVYHKLVDNLGMFHELQARGAGAAARRELRELRTQHVCKRVTLSAAPPPQGPVYAPPSPERDAPAPAGGFDVLELD